MNMNPITIPTTPGALIRAALRDLRACEADDRYIVDMSDCHAPITDDDGRKVCRVGLVGAVLAQTLGEPHDRSISDDDLEQYGCETKKLMIALTHFRYGELDLGLFFLYHDQSELSEEWEKYASEVVYDASNPDEFHARMNSLADYLASCGL